MALKIDPAKLDAFRALVAESMADVFEDYLEMVRTSDDPEDLRKFMEWAGKITGAEAKKQDDTAKLPVVNISFQLGGGMQVAAPDTLPMVEVVLPEEIAPVEPAPPKPSQSAMDEVVNQIKALAS